MRQVIDFRSSNGDTDYPESNAILPVTDGEAANQTIFRRPTENTRLRTELLRTVLHEHACLVDANTHLYSAVPGNPTTFEGVYPANSGTFLLGTDLVLVSFGSPGRSTSYPYVGSSKASLSVGTPSSNEVVFTSVKKQWEGSAFPAADANAISVEIVAGASLTVTLKGASGNLNHIYITIVSGTTTCNDLITAVNVSAANTLVLASLGSGSTGTNAAALWGAPQWSGDYTQRFLKGGVAGVLHTITPTVLATFFAASTANRIQEGDMIGVWYDKNVDTTGTGGRLQSTYENGNYVLTAGQLFNSRRQPEKIPNCIPICKAINSTTLLFADGSLIQVGYPAPLGFDSLQISWAYNGMAGLYNCYDGVNEGVKRVSTGTHPHNPALTNREAFENIDEQVYALRGHTGVFVSVTDGSASTGGQYNGPGGLRAAFLALAAANGGTIHVRKGSYTFSVNLSTTKAIRIIGVEEGVTITANHPSGYAMTFTSSAAGSRIENVNLISGSGPDLLDVQAANVTIEQCQLTGNGRLLNVTSTAKLRVLDTQITGTGVGQQLIYMAAGGSSGMFDNCTITVPDNNIGLNATAGVRLVISNTKIICSPFTTAQWVVSIEGGIIRLDNVEWTVTGTGDIYTSLLNVQADALVATNLYFNMANQLLRFAANNSPIILVSPNGVVDGLTIINAGKIPTSGGDGFILNYLVPYVRVTGFGGLVTIRNAKLSGFVMSGAPSGAAQFTVFGDQSAAAQRYTIEGSGVFEDVYVDLSGLTHTDIAAYYACFSGIQPESMFDDCKIELGATGYLTHGWYVIDTTDVTIEACTIRSTLANAIYCLVEMAATISGANYTYRNSVNNCSFKFNDMVSTSPGMINLSFVNGANAYNTITSNRIHNTGTTATGKYIILLATSVMRTVVTGNTIKKGAAGNTAIQDNGTANLWQTATSSDPLNVIF